ncbi:MAG: serine/threonine-protein kinase [Nannocystaceae bacterium]
MSENPAYLPEFSHVRPHVPQIYDLGEVDEQIFVAMEYVVGVTLRDWIRDEARTWRQILDVCVGAGRGLKAVHDAGLIHRDFKPRNVLVGEDGRARVLDFGLSHPERALPDLNAAASLSGASVRTSVLSGTPAYIAPEIYLGGEIDVRSDIFAFCVTLYECLYGARPFAGEGFRELREAIVSDALRPPPDDARVPAWLRKVVLRGLRGDPRERWSSMDELLSELDRAPQRRRRALLAGVTGLALLGLVGGGIYQRQSLEEELAARRCDELGAVDETWSEARRAAVEAALLGSDLPYAASTWTRVASRLDRYADELAAARRGACDDHRRGAVSDTLYDLRLACLDRRARDLEAAVDHLASADAEALPGAIKVAAELPELTACASTKRLLDRIPPPDDAATAAAVAELRDDLRAVRVMVLGGVEAAAKEAIAPIVRRAREVAYAPTLAEALTLDGWIRERNGEFDDAVAPLMEGLWTAEACGHDRVAADAALHLTLVEGYRLARFDAADRWTQLADAILTRSGGPGDLEPRREQTSGALALRRGDLDGALGHFERSADAARRRQGPDSVTLGSALSNIGMVQAIRGDFEAALPVLQEARAHSERIFGPDHPEVALLLGNIASAHLQAGKHREALALFTEALRLHRSLHHEGHIEISRALHNMASVNAALGDFAAARDLDEEALAIRLRSLGREHPDTALVYVNLAAIYRYLGDPEVGLARAREALDILEATLGADHRDYVVGLVESSANLEAMGAFDAAIDEASRAIRLYEAQPSPPPDQLAHARLTLAFALWQAGRERPRALALGRQAYVELAGQNLLDHPEGRSLRVWLEEHDPEFMLGPAGAAAAAD